MGSLHDPNAEGRATGDTNATLLDRLRGARIITTCIDPSNFTECYPPVDGRPTHVAVEVADHALVCEAVALLAECRKALNTTSHPVDGDLDALISKIDAALAAKEPNA